MDRVPLTKKAGWRGSTHQQPDQTPRRLIGAGAEPAHPRQLITEPGMGYRFQP